MTRSFAHLGLAPLHLFIGEAVLCLFIFLRPAESLARLFDISASPAWLQGFSIAYIAAVCYGVFEVGRGILLAHDPLAIVETFAFHIYPLYLFAGLWIGGMDPGRLRRVVRWLAWVNGIYGILFIAVLNHVFILMPGTRDTPLFSQPNGSAVIVLALLCFEPDLSKVLHLLVLNCFVALGMEVRAELLALVVGLAVWSVLARKIVHLTVGASAFVMVFAAALATDIRIPAPASRGGEISARFIAGRVLSTIDVDLASKYAPTARNYEGTYKWRERWWKAIWNEVHGSTTTALLGEGEGYPLSSLVGYINDPNVRTPHDVFFYCLGYEGWLGVGLFAAMQAALAQGFWRVYRVTGQPYGIIFWSMTLAAALFSNYFETPFGAIPFYLLSGLILAPVQSWSIAYEDLAGSQLLSTARG